MGGIALGVALLNAPLLMRANLGRNNLGDAAMHAVAESLSHGATGLKELLLERNGAGEESLITLLEAATTHGHLYQLDIRGMTLHAAVSCCPNHRVSLIALPVTIGVLAVSPA